MIPDFFLLIINLLSSAHYSTILITSRRFALHIPITAKSSASAKQLCLPFFNLSIRSLNMIINSVGLATPP